MSASGAGYRRLLASVLDRADDPVEGLLEFFRLAADALESSDFADGCPVATTALDTASTDPVVREACARVLESWVDDIAAALRPAFGPRARPLAVTGLATLEGAFVLCRASRSVQPLHDAGSELGRLLRPD